jgi:signal peptidase
MSRARSPSSGDPGPPSGRDGGEDGGSWRLFARDLATSAVAVLLVGAYLFAVSGVWPPLVAVESGSMVPNMEENDLVFVMEEGRFAGDGDAGDTGVVTAATGRETGYETFGRPGDVIVYEPNGNGQGTPIIHRAMLWAEPGEDWVARANESYLARADTCEEVRHCPVEEPAFITKGDNNAFYDQARASPISEPVEPEWVVGTAEVRIPGLGWLRLRT